jgi:hypothetical protein
MGGLPAQREHHEEGPLMATVIYRRHTKACKAKGAASRCSCGWLAQV